MAKKKKKSSEGSLGGSIVLGAVTALIGLFLGILALALDPVSEMRDQPAEDKIEAKTVYFILGKDRGGNYKGKERAFMERQTGALRLSEEELNRWAVDTFKFSKPKKGEEENVGMINLKPSAPNFRITDGIFQIGMSVEVIAFGQKHKMRYQAKGDFVPTAEGYAFEPSSSYLGSAHLPSVGVAPFVGDTLFGVFQNAEQYAALHEAWISLTSVTIDGNSLVLVRQ
ncbi:hypothetical protein [Cerasicoccus arenae]|uniref:Uncharacterized protein n=1 Tax=Cerasicoccus arenae TaxID=424488 RepID=A0A8J3DK42_9BACT|nr:hypothetical protein [Cerasicoccus arenae]MBK1858444.1 hypothetical protein [Cerasicoccus arenae]GHC02608.1 hypothetical protein GCM10007047_18990 [Cerasicoccus arenae]